MGARRTARKPEFEVDLQLLLGVIFQKLWMIGIVSVLCAIIAFMATYWFVAPKYQSYTMFYVNNNSFSVGENLSIGAGDISASKSLVESYVVILLTRQTLTDVADYAGVDRSYEEMRDMITAVAMNSTEIVRVNVTSTDPQEAYKIAQAIEYVLPHRIAAVVEGSSAKVVDKATVSYARVSPDYAFNSTIGFMIGVFLTIVFITVRTVLDTRVRSEEDITRTCTHPILSAVPNMTAPSKGGYYGYGEKKKSISQRVGDIIRQPDLFGSGISFAAAEAYKLLRTKILFAFADNGGCRVIGVSSALAGEGKSLTSINMAYSMSQLGKRVLLIDCDLRRPSLAAKLPLRKDPGLSNYLTAQCTLEELIQPCGIANEENAFHVMTSGPNPPNPVELLSSERMTQMLNILRDEYDYVILDFPPVGEVSDALAITKQADGMLLVVRQNYCDKHVFHSVVRQFGFLDTKILGVVYNCASEGNGLYKKYYYKYRKSKYENSYEVTARKARKAAQQKTEGKSK